MVEMVELNANMAPLLLLAAFLGTAIYGNSKVQALRNAASQLDRSIHNFRVHSFDSSNSLVYFKVDLHVLNPTQTTIPISNLLIDLYAVKSDGNLQQIGNSRPTGPFDVANGNTVVELKFSLPTNSALIQLITGGTQRYRIVTRPFIKGKELDAVVTDVNLQSQFSAVKDLFKSIGLGYTTGPKAHIKSGAEYEKYWDRSLYKNTEIPLGDGDTFLTIKLMEEYVQKSIPQVRQIAQALKKSTRYATLENVFKYFHENYQYKKDEPGKEQLREAIASWVHRKTGIDCDCFSISISAILSVLNIPHSFRKTMYKGDNDYSHIYVVAFDTNGREVIMDPVIQQFNYEAPGLVGKFDKRIV